MLQITKNAEKIAEIGKHILRFPQTSLDEIHKKFELSLAKT